MDMICGMNITWNNEISYTHIHTYWSEVMAVLVIYRLLWFHPISCVGLA